MGLGMGGASFSGGFPPSFAPTTSTDRVTGKIEIRSIRQRHRGRGGSLARDFTTGAASPASHPRADSGHAEEGGRNNTNSY